MEVHFHVKLSVISITLEGYSKAADDLAKGEQIQGEEYGYTDP